MMVRVDQGRERLDRERAGSLLAAASALALWAAITPAHATEADCAALKGADLPPSLSIPNGGAKVTVAAFTALGGMSYCQIEGEAAPVSVGAPPVRFRVNLPDRWNRKAIQFGGGGLNGNLGPGVGGVADAPPGPSPLARGYAIITTDGGHSAQPTQQAFGMNDEALANHAFGAYKKAHDFGFAIIARYYDGRPDKSYFVGSSEGGREALMVAQRAPNDYDGIVASAPLVSFMGVQLSKVGGFQRFGAEPFTDAQVALAQRAALTACDELDGLKDGVISKTDACRVAFKPRSLRCPDGKPGHDDCLSDKQAAWLEQIRTPYRFAYPLANNQADYPPFGIGGELQPGGLANWLKGQEPGEVAIVRNFVLKAPQTKEPFDESANAARVQALSALLDATNPDLSAFHAHGGKLIMKANGADYVVSPALATRYYNLVAARFGQAETDRFVRYYINPGVNHFGSGLQADGSDIPDKVDWVDALDGWVVRGAAPENLVVTAYARPAGQQAGGGPGPGPGAGGPPGGNAGPPGPAIASRVLCRFPGYPHFNGGDPKSSSSFACRADKP